MPYHVYLLASRRYGTLYIGVTNDLARRVWEHKEKAHKGFTAKYGVDRLVWYERYERIDEAIAREKKCQEMAARLEDRLDRGIQSGLVGPLRPSRKLSAVIPGLATGENPEPMNVTAADRIRRASRVRPVFAGFGLAFGAQE